MGGEIPREDGPGADLRGRPRTEGGIEEAGIGPESIETLRFQAGHFERNKDAVAYADYRARGRVTASSEVESAHKNVVQHRLKISGAWWNPATVCDILALRMLRHNGWWDDDSESQHLAWSVRATTFARNRPSKAA